MECVDLLDAADRLASALRTDVERTWFRPMHQ